MQIDQSALVYIVGVGFSIFMSVVGYYIKETLSTIKVFGKGQEEIKNSLIRIETDLLNMKDNYSVLTKRTDNITTVLHEQGIKIAKLEEKVGNGSKVA